MPSPLDQPVDHTQIATFSEEGDSAAIRYSVPLPGAYSFDRIVPLDLNQADLTVDSKSIGKTPVQLGIVELDDDSIISKVNATQLARHFKMALPAEARPSRRLAVDLGADVESADDDARAVLPAVPRLARTVMADRHARDALIEALAAAQQQQADSAALASLIIPIAGLGNSLRLVPLKTLRPDPRIAIVETFEVSSSLGDYGLGRTLQTFSLLPGERTTISVDTWRTFEESQEDATSIFDSSDTAAQTRFTSALANESGAAFQDQGGWGFSVGVQAGGGVNLGLVSANASVETGFSANHQEARQSFSKSVSQSASDHAAQVNTARRQAVQSASSSTQSGGSSESTVREILNTNLRRVLNFVFRELNQTYRVRTSLRAVKVAFYNGNSDSAEVVTLAEMPRLLRKYIAPDKQEKVARAILALVTECIDDTGTSRTMLQCGTRKQGGFEWKPATLTDDGDLDFAENPLQAKFCWRIKPGPIGQEGVAEKSRVNGVITDSTEIVLRTDNIVIEALLGRADALDPYASALQALDLRSREADIAWREADTGRLGAALKLIDAQTADKKVTAWERILGDQPDIQVVPVASVNGAGPQ